ncbi:MAG: type III pantothenate kinase [Bacteroidales bacterium]|nr:type III pantothenate kinase [Bacteroidales bacterium]
MNLAIDIGNSKTKLAVFEQEQIKHILILSDPEKQIILDLISDFSVQKVIISSVRTHKPGYFDFLTKKAHFIIMDQSVKLPFNNLYETPETLGNDRKALVSGARVIFPSENTLIISAGTAITYDFLDNKGQYHGGAISPGMNMRFKALNNFTEKLPLVDYCKFSGFTGTTTETSLAAGVLQGITGEIKEFIRLYEKEFGNLKIILTGGDAKHFDKNLKNNIFAIPNLVLIGLNEIMEFNV